MSNCPLHCMAKACARWWSVRPLYKTVSFLRRLLGEEDVRRNAVNALDLHSGERILDMCSGMGGNLSLLAERDLELYAAETSRDYAEATRLEIRDHRWHNIRAIHWTDTRLPFASASFDAILITYGMTRTNNPGFFIAECERLLKPGGRIVVVDWVSPRKGGGFLTGLLWPLHVLMGCNPYTPWQHQFARAFEVCRKQEIYAGIATLTYGRQRANHVVGPLPLPTFATPAPSETANAPAGQASPDASSATTTPVAEAPVPSAKADSAPSASPLAAVAPSVATEEPKAEEKVVPAEKTRNKSGRKKK